MRSQRARLISHSYRGLHRGQRSLTAQTGRTYDRTAPVAPSFEKALVSGAVPPKPTWRFRQGALDGRSFLARLPVRVWLE